MRLQATVVTPRCRPITDSSERRCLAQQSSWSRRFRGIGLTGPRVLPKRCDRNRKSTDRLSQTIKHILNGENPVGLGVRWREGGTVSHWIPVCWVVAHYKARRTTWSRIDLPATRWNVGRPTGPCSSQQDGQPESTRIRLDDRWVWASRR